MCRIKILVAIVVIASFVISPIAYAHSGRTDSQGGHTCRTKCVEKWGLEYGEYHYHNNKIKVKIKAKQQTRQKSRRKSR